MVGFLEALIDRSDQIVEEPPAIRTECDLTIGLPLTEARLAARGVAAIKNRGSSRSARRLRIRGLESNIAAFQQRFGVSLEPSHFSGLPSSPAGDVD
jgi:hypothetical protein